MAEEDTESALPFGEFDICDDVGEEEAPSLRVEPPCSWCAEGRLVVAARAAREVAMAAHRRRQSAACDWSE